MLYHQMQELIALVEEGSRLHYVGYYPSACVLFQYPKGVGRLCADKWGFALLGKIRVDNTLKRYEEVYNALPESNPACLRMLWAVAQLLGLTLYWEALVEIHYACQETSNDPKDAIEEFKRVVININRTNWARETMADTLKQYREQVAQSAVSVR